ncbi:MAG: hypothetical protein AB7N91_18130 [Candidatus Tectimicrobiota bacterium]
MTSQQGTTATAEQSTGVKDEMYNVVSVLYHALQGGETAMQYLHDAQEAGEQELARFFQEVQDCQKHLAKRAKTMLAQHLTQGQGNGHESFHPQGAGMQERRSSTDPQGQTSMGNQSHGHGTQGYEEAQAHEPRRS